MSLNAHDIEVFAVVDGITIRRHELIVDNPRLLRREYYNLDGELCGWIPLMTIMTSNRRPWGTYYK